MDFSFLSLRPQDGADERHPVLGTDIHAEPADGQEVIYLAAGCFWGVEKAMWEQPGVIATATGYMGGLADADHPTYRQVCTGRTDHAETVRVVYDPERLPTSQLLAAFFEMHDPTQGDRQGNDIGTQYRSAIWTTTPEQAATAQATLDGYQQVLTADGFPAITTEVATADDAGTFWYAEPEHQAYLWHHPDGYQCHARTGRACPVVPAGR